MVYRDGPSHSYSEAQAAEMLGMSVRMLADRRRAGKIQCVKDGHVVRYTQQHIDAYVAKFDTSQPAEPVRKSSIPKEKTDTARLFKRRRVLTAEDLERSKRSAERIRKSGSDSTKTLIFARQNAIALQSTGASDIGDKNAGTAGDLAPEAHAKPPLE